MAFGRAEQPRKPDLTPGAGRSAQFVVGALCDVVSRLHAHRHPGDARLRCCRQIFYSRYCDDWDQRLKYSGKQWLSRFKGLAKVGIVAHKTQLTTQYTLW